MNPALSGAWVYQYDRRHRLRNATAPGYTGAFTFSAAGNISTANVTGPVHPRNVTYGYGAVDPQAVDRLTSTGGAIYASFNYDRAGNTTRRVTPDGTSDLEWDGEDQLRESVGGGKREAYWYDHEGQRTLAILQDGATTEARFWVDLSETTFGTTTKRWLYLPGARVENRSAIELNYADHVSSAEVTLDTNGVPVTAFVYTPWGEPLASMGTTSMHRRRFNDKDNDAATGLSYYGFRYYDPLAARWTGADPLFRFSPDETLGVPTRLNLYEFSGNNPIRLYDADGLAEPGAVAADALAQCGSNPSCQKVAAALVTTAPAVAVGIGLVIATPAGFFVATEDSPNGCRFDACANSKADAQLRHYEKFEESRQSIRDQERAEMGAVHESGSVGTRMTRVENKPMEAARVDRAKPSGDRAGMDFTPKGKKTIWEVNKQKHGGTNKCDNCGKRVVKPKKHVKNYRVR